MSETQSKLLGADISDYLSIKKGPSKVTGRTSAWEPLVLTHLRLMSKLESFAGELETMHDKISDVFAEGLVDGLSRSSGSYLEGCVRESASRGLRFPFRKEKELKDLFVAASKTKLGQAIVAICQPSTSDFLLAKGNASPCA